MFIITLVSALAFLPSGTSSGDSSKMTACCLLWSGCMAFHRRKTAERDESKRVSSCSVHLATAGPLSLSLGDRLMGRRERSEMWGK